MHGLLPEFSDAPGRAYPNPPQKQSRVAAIGHPLYFSERPPPPYHRPICTSGFCLENNHPVCVFSIPSVAAAVCLCHDRSTYCYCPCPTSVFYRSMYWGIFFPPADYAPSEMRAVYHPHLGVIVLLLLTLALTFWPTLTRRAAVGGLPPHLTPNVLLFSPRGDLFRPSCLFLSNSQVAGRLPSLRGFVACRLSHIQSRCRLTVPGVWAVVLPQ